MSGMRKKRKRRAEAEVAGDAPEEIAEVSGPETDGADGGVQSDDANHADDDDADDAEGREIPEGERLKMVLESLLFVSDGPLTINRMRQLTHVKSNQIIRDVIDELVAEYSTRGIVLYQVGGGYQFRSHSSTSHWVQKLVVGRPVRLSRAQLETLAIIAYRQPITRPEIDDIRGVDASGTLRLLLERDLIRVLGKKEEPGRPLLYGSTPEFLEFFNLNDLRDLPTLKEFSELTDESMELVEDTLGPEPPGDQPPSADEPDGEDAMFDADPELSVA